MSTEDVIPFSEKTSETAELTSPTSGIRFDPGYVKTIPGILKASQAILSLIGFICGQTIRRKVYLSAGGWYTFVSMPAFFISTFFLCCYVFHIVEKFKKIPWLLTELGYAVAWCILFFIASFIAGTRVSADPPWGAAAFFGFLAMGAFGFEAAIKYQRWKEDELAQGTRPVEFDATTETDPNANTF